MSKIRSIEVYFPVEVELSNERQHDLVTVIDDICKRYEREHPGRVMWPFGIGNKITHMPITAEQEAAGEHMEFDESCFSIECSERADYNAICTRCGKPQGDHRDHIIDPPAGDCEFSISQ